MIAMAFSLFVSLSYGSGDFMAGRVAHKLPSALIVLVTQGMQTILVLGIRTYERSAVPGFCPYLWGSRRPCKRYCLYAVLQGLYHGCILNWLIRVTMASRK